VVVVAIILLGLRNFITLIAVLLGAIGGVVVVVCFVYTISKSTADQMVAKMIRKVMKLVDKQFTAVRHEMFKNIQGNVLDVGCGAGEYFKYYQASGRVSGLVALEPNTHLHNVIQERISGLSPSFPTSITNDFIQNIEGEGIFDSIVLGNVLCEVPNVPEALYHVNRLLRKGGRVYFSEHVIFPSDLHRFFQNIVNPIWVIISGGCNCNRDTLAYINAQPWETVSWTFEDAGNFPWIGPFVVGIALKK